MVGGGGGGGGGARGRGVCAEFKFRELGLPGSRLLKNGEQQVDFALGKWRAQKLKQEGKQFLKMGQHFTKLRNRLVNYNYATDFHNPAKIHKVAKFRKVAKIYASETRLLDQPASKIF